MLADLMELVYAHDELADLDPAARRLALRELLSRSDDVDEIADAVALVANEIDGYGPISTLMSDSETTDILINGPCDVWVEAHGRLRPVSCRFDSSEHLHAWCERHITAAGGRLDAAAPISDVRLADGSRMHVVLPPVATAGPLVSIRRFPNQPRSIEALVANGSMTQDEADALRMAVSDARSIVISGATSTGKTTLLNALVSLVPERERVVMIEELPELTVDGGNRISLTARGANAEGRGEVTLEHLVKASLRMRPDRIVVGEVRGGEALAALWAMSTGHRGSMLSIHASSAGEASQRLVDLALMSELAPDERTLRREVDRAVDVNVHLIKRAGTRAIDRIVVTR